MATYVKDTRTGYQVKLDDTAGLIGAAITAHEAAVDPHPTYLTEAEGDAAYSALGHTHVPADIVTVNNNRLLGRHTGGVGGAEEVTIGQALQISGSSLQVDLGTSAGQAAAGNHTHALDDLSDVTITTPSTDQVIKYNGSAWVNAAAPAGATTLDGLTDVTITSPSANQVLKYNGSEWVNAAAGSGGATITAGYCSLKRTGTTTTTAGVWTSVGFDVEEADTKDWHSNSTNNSRITVDATGLYQLTAHAQWGANSRDTALRFYKNGSVSLASTYYSTQMVNSQRNLSALVYLAAGDYVELQLYNGTSNETIAADTASQAYCHFAAARVSDDVSAGGTGGIAQQIVSTTTYAALEDTQHILTNASATTITLPPPNYTVALLHMDGTNGSTTITDEIAGNTWTCNYNAQLSTTQQKFGTASAYFDGSQDNISIPSASKFDLGSSDYCIEGWVYITSLATARSLWSRRYDGAAGWCWVVSAAGAVYGRLVIGGAWTDNFCITGNGVVTVNTWHHIAIVRRSLSHYIYVDGVQQSTNSNTGVMQTHNYPVRLGVSTQVTLEAPMLGYIDDFRFTVGSPVYTGAFTPPSSALVVVGPSPGSIIGVCPANNRADNVINPNGGTIQGSSSNVTLSSRQPVQLEWTDSTNQWQWRVKQGMSDGDVIGMIMGLS